MNDKNGKNGRRSRRIPGKRHAKVIRMPPATESWSAEEAVRVADVFPWVAELAAHQERDKDEPLDEKAEAWLANFPERFQESYRRTLWRQRFESIHPMGQEVESEFKSGVTFGTGGNGWKAFATVNADPDVMHGFLRFSVNLVEADTGLGRVMEEGHYGHRVVVQVEHDGTKPSKVLVAALLADPRFGRLFQIHRVPGKPESPTSFELISRLLATCPLHLESMAQFVERAGKHYGFKAKAMTHDLPFLRDGDECDGCYECRCTCKCAEGAAR